MKKLPLRLFFLLFLICSISECLAQTPVLLRVVRSDQSDTLGCNFVEELTRIVYNEIIGGRTKLWDSPSKEIQITSLSLKEIERSSGTKFTDQEIIFIYEYWVTSSKSLRSMTQGFSFNTKNTVGEDVSFGYVDYKDVQDAFLSARVNTNANGNFSASILNYINTKNYVYNILQFGGEVLKGVSESESIKERFIGTNQFNTTNFSSDEIAQKMVTYTIDFESSLDTKKLLAGKQFVNAIQSYLVDNKEVFYNLGGDRIMTHLQQKKWTISRVTVKELWKKTDNTISYAPVSVTLFVNDSSLAEIPYRDMVKMEIQVSNKPWTEVLKEKNFQMTITRINSQDILAREAYLYLKALQNAEWNKVTEYVEENVK